MAYDITPSVEWQRILDIKDEEEQGRAATEYVSFLERHLDERTRNEIKTYNDMKMDIISNIMKRKPFSEWLKQHDSEIYELENQKLNNFK